jgi:hypothetical protein
MNRRACVRVKARLQAKLAVQRSFTRGRQTTLSRSAGRACFHQYHHHRQPACLGSSYRIPRAGLCRSNTITKVWNPEGCSCGTIWAWWTHHARFVDSVCEGWLANQPVIATPVLKAGREVLQVMLKLRNRSAHIRRHSATSQQATRAGSWMSQFNTQPAPEHDRERT